MKKIDFKVVLKKIKHVKKSKLAKKAKATAKNLAIRAKRESIKFVLVICLILFGLIAGGEAIRKFLNKPIEEVIKPKIVSTYQIGKGARMEVLGEVVKENTVQVYAQTSGIVNSIFVTDGEQVSKGKQLAYISTNYQGESAQAVSRQIAYKNYAFQKDNYDNQKETIAKQKELAENGDTSYDKLREISEGTIGNLKDQVSYNSDSLSQVDQLLTDLNAQAQSTDRDSAIANTRNLRNSLFGANTQLNSNIQTLEYNTDTDNSPDKISNLTKDTTLKQLELAEKALDLNKEISYLQLRLAQINESLVRPASFLTGIVQKVHVSLGQTVNPGKLLFTIAGPDDTIRVDVMLNKSLADNFSMIEKAYALIDGEKIELDLIYRSTEATNGTLYNLSFSVDETEAQKFVNSGNVRVSIPVGVADTSASMPLVPIDAVTQTSQGSFLFVVEDGKAKTKEVSLGNLFGQYVMVYGGLSDEDKVIIDRHVLDGDQVKLLNDE